MKKPTRRLANVEDRSGRVDVALYRMACVAAYRLEREQGIVGLREHVLPLVEDLILKNVPAQNLLPRELTALIKVCELNRARSQA
jgi:hypothetical protein